MFIADSKPVQMGFTCGLQDRLADVGEPGPDRVPSGGPFAVARPPPRDTAHRLQKTDLLSATGPTGYPFRIASAARSAIIIVGALVLPDTSAGITEQSVTRSPSTPLTRRSRSTTHSAPGPILQVPAGWKIVRACLRMASSSVLEPMAVTVRGAMTRVSLMSAMRETVELTGMIFFIIIGAALFNFFIETTGLPQQLIATVEQSGLSPFATLILIVAFYLVLGCFMDSMSIIMLTIPFVFPLISKLGYDPIWFGILVVTVAELGLITPPIGMNLFIVQGVSKDLTSATVIRGILPFVLADCVRLALLILIPSLALALPARM